MTATELKAQLARFRKRYASWKAEHSRQQNEELVNQFLLLKAQFKAQGLPLKDLDTPLDIDAQSFQRTGIVLAIPKPHHFAQPFAPVRSSGKIDGPPICLDDYLPYFKDFIIASPTSWIVGGTCEHDNTKGDLDMLHMLPDTEEISRIIDFRIFRMLPPHLAERIHALWETRGARSPFTSFYPLYRLRYERIPDAQVIAMGEGKDDISPSQFLSSHTGFSRVPPSPLDPPSFSEIKLRTKGTEKQEGEANKALRSNKITLGEFFLPQKPCRSYVPSQAQTLEFFLSFWKDEQFPVYSSRKADGLNSEFHISKTGKVRMYTEDGTDETDSFSQTIEEAKKLAPDHNLILLAEIEWWEGKQHFPREYAAGKVHRKLSDEAGIVVNVYDLVYFDSDIHNESFEERWKRLKNLNFPQCSEVPSPKYKWNLIPNIKNADRKVLERETERLRKIPGCFPFDQKLFADPFSFKKAKEFKAGDSILSEEGLQTVIQVSYEDLVGDLVTIYSRLFPFTVTENHPVQIIRREKRRKRSSGKYRIPFKKLSSQDLSQCPREWVNAAGLDSDCFMILPKFRLQGPSFLCVDDGKREVEIPVDRDLAYFFGWYVAEGWSNDGSINLELNSSAQRHYGEKLSQIVADKFGLHLHWHPQKGPDSVCPGAFYHTALSRLMHRAFGHKAPNKHVPPFIMLAPPDVVRSFLQGFFLGDGCKKPHTFRFTTSSETLAQQLILLLTKLDMCPSCHKISRAGSWISIKGRSYQQHDLYNVEVAAFQGHRLFPDFHYDGVNRGSQFLEDEHNFYVRVRKIKKEFVSCKVVNIETQSHHVLTPFITHNSEGNVAKQADASYDLTGSRPMSWIKFHNSSQFVAIVIKAVETKTKGTFNLEWGLLPGNRPVKKGILKKVDDREIAYGGKTFAVTEEAMGRRGEHITIECETFNDTYDMKTETYDFSAWCPRFLGKTGKKLDTIESAEKRAIRDFCFQGKLKDLDGRTHYLPGGKSGEEFPSK